MRFQRIICRLGQHFALALGLFSFGLWPAGAVDYTLSLHSNGRAQMSGGPFDLLGAEASARSTVSQGADFLLVAKPSLSPNLEILQNGGVIILRWRRDWTFSLEAADYVGAPWLPVGDVSAQGDFLYFTTRPANRARFFRLVSGSRPGS